MTAAASFWRILIGRCRRDDETRQVKRDSAAKAAEMKAEIVRSMLATDSMVSMLLKDRQNDAD